MKKIYSLKTQRLIVSRRARPNNRTKLLRRAVRLAGGLHALRVEGSRLGRCVRRGQVLRRDAEVRVRRNTPIDVHVRVVHPAVEENLVAHRHFSNVSNVA